MVKKRENLTQDLIKIRILAYLYNKENPTNAYTIQQRSLIPSQESNRFKGFLEDLYNLGNLEKIEEESGGEKSRTSYKITRKGKDTVERYRDPLIQQLFGSIEDFFL